MRSLSKSQYTKGRQCLKALWLYRHSPELGAEFGAFQQGIADQGTSFGILARDRFPGGTLISAGHDQPEEALAQTQAALAAGAKVLYEAAFLYDGVLVRVDLLVKEPEGWALIEVKSGTGVEDVHLQDVAIQRYVVTGAGFVLNRMILMHANSQYVRQGDLDLTQLFKMMDVTMASEDELLFAASNVAEMKVVAHASSAPMIPIGGHCAKPYECSFKAHCWAHVPEYSVFNLAYAKMPQKIEMFNSGVQLIEQINPDLHKLTPGQQLQVALAKSRTRRVDMKALRKFLGALTWPLTHLDFETDNPVVPPFDGLRPYQQMPFQASVRVQSAPGAVLTHHEYLGDGRGDPRVGLVDFLVKHVANAGSIVAYHKSFEAGRLDELAADSAVTDSRYQGTIKRMVDRLWDLADPFRTGAYAHPDFRGRWSIKAVLPVLVPEMSYSGLEIKDGAAAMAAYAQLRDPKLPDAERARLINALKVYCGQDTQAMVAILDHLQTLVREG